MDRKLVFNLSVALSILLLFVLNIFLGAVNIPFHDTLDILCGKGSGRESWEYIILQTRLPQALTATLCGGALSVSGLLLQTAFRNPLAGPSVFGINSGASLGVAVVMLFLGGSITAGTVSVSGFLATLLAAFAGSMAVMSLLLLFSMMVKSKTMLLFIGIMIGYIASSAIALLNFFSTEEGVHSYMIWGLGNFGGVSMDMMPAFAMTVIIGLMGALLMIKPLNAILLGDRYAENLGVNTARLRNKLIIITGLLTAVTTAFCGPIAFIGLAVPHIVRMASGTEDHTCLIPGTILTGAAVALLCNLISIIPGDSGMIPLNSITPLMGAPVIIYVIMSKRRS